MAKGSRYRVQLRRRREGKTDYQARKAFVVSRKPRLVARSSLKNTIAQIVVAKPYGDVVLASAHSKELVKKFGWKAATGNVPAAYLTGLLCGLKAKANGVAEAILDIGLVSPTKGSKVFATLSGVVDAGVVVPHDEAKLVAERTEGEHIVEYAKSLGTPEEYAPKFSVSLAKELPPEQLGEHFEKVKADILSAFGISVKAKVKVKPAAKAEVKVEAKAAGAKGKPKAEKADAKGKSADAKAKPADVKASKKSGAKKAKTGGKKE
jgi:large subunit ribosomal protein L18